VQAKQLSEEGRKHAGFFSEIVAGVDRTTHLLEQLLALARADSRRTDEVTKDDVDLHAVSVNVLAELGSQALNKGIDLSLEADDPETTIRGDTAALRILLRNLVDNAIRYTPEGGRIEVALQSTPKAVLLRVSDDGPGIPEEQRPLLFERFQRGEAATAQGSGLGLSIVAQIAELHGAGIRLGSGLDGRGLSVHLEFPAASA
jgi:signal transduction histidine kinase